ncbi:MAG TPA: hypothetical protein VHV55_25490 [Pirellulales bacterium]|nr:hypothetical protein [Pirellulales bacterium]
MYDEADAHGPTADCLIRTSSPRASAFCGYEAIEQKVAKSAKKKKEKPEEWQFYRTLASQFLSSFLLRVLRVLLFKFLWC